MLNGEVLSRKAIAAAVPEKAWQSELTCMKNPVQPVLLSQNLAHASTEDVDSMSPTAKSGFAEFANEAAPQIESTGTEQLVGEEVGELSVDVDVVLASVDVVLASVVLVSDDVVLASVVVLDVVAGSTHWKQVRS